MNRKLRIFALLAASTLALGACSNSASKPEATKQETKPATSAIDVVATTNVWGAVAKAVAGDSATVKSIITSPDQDPHDYQASAQDKLVFNDAKIVLVNGGGYDDWATKLAKSAPNHPQILDAVAISGLQGEDKHDDHDDDHKDEHKDEHGHTHAHGEFNEHVFYSLDTAAKVAEQVSEKLAAALPEKAATFKANAEAFKKELDALEDRAEKARRAGAKAIATEPVAGYLLAEMEIHDVTPAEYVAQSESDAGASAALIADITETLTAKRVNMLVLNAQTEDAVSQKFADAAKAANIPVVGVYETLPQDNMTYIAFMEQMISALEAANRA